MARDFYHEQVKEALLKDGWTITADPYILKLGGKDSVEIDIGAEKVIQAERDGTKIVVEVKSFLNRSIIYDFHQAYGQFIFYRKALINLGHDPVLYLAMPEDTYREFSNKPYYRDFMQAEMSLLIYDPNKKIITRWIN